MNLSMERILVMNSMIYQRERERVLTTDNNNLSNCTIKGIKNKTKNKRERTGNPVTSKY